MRRILIILGICVGITTLIIALRSCSGEGGTKISTERVEKRSIVETVSANGKVYPEVAVKISPDVSGEVVELNVKQGQKVEKGELLLKIKPDLYVSTVERMVASVNTAKANYENSQARLAQVKAQFVNAESSFNRNKKLYDQKAISPSEFDAAQAQYEGSKAEVEASQKSVLAAEFNVKNAEAALNESKNNLDKTVMYAPVSGTVSKLNIEKGERVVGTTQMAGTELLTISNLNEMEVRVDVNENDIVRVHMNDTALIEVDAYLNKKFKGIVTEVAQSANTTGVSADQITNFAVKIRILQKSYANLIDSANKHLSPFKTGMSATVDIQTKTVQNVLSVPIQAVTTRSDSTIKSDEKANLEDNSTLVVKNEVEEKKKEAEKKDEKPKECVFIYDADIKKARLVLVKTGVQDNNYIQITEGLKESDEIIAAPYTAISRTLRDKMRVKKVDKKELYKAEPKS